MVRSNPSLSAITSDGKHLSRLLHSRLTLSVVICRTKRRRTSSLQFFRVFPHRANHVVQHCLDVAILCNGAVTQNALNDRVIHGQAVQVRSKLPAEPVPTGPLDALL